MKHLRHIYIITLLLACTSCNSNKREIKLNNDQWLIPTGEVSLTNIVSKCIIEYDKLPLRMVAATPCFRAEAGAAGKDTKGMIRQHQFTKVELVSIIQPEFRLKELDRLVNCAELILQKLKNLVESNALGKFIAMPIFHISH